MEYFPANYFDKIITRFCPFGDPFQFKNIQLYKNLYRILKFDGTLEINNIIELLRQRHPNMKITNIKNIIKDEFKNIGFKHISFKTIKYPKIGAEYLTILQK